MSCLDDIPKEFGCKSQRNVIFIEDDKKAQDHLYEHLRMQDDTPIGYKIMPSKPLMIISPHIPFPFY